jgi:ribosomal protein L6P/L9E
MLSKTFILPLSSYVYLFYFSKYKVILINVGGSCNKKYFVVPLISHVQKFDNLITISIARSCIKRFNYRVFNRLFKFWVSLIKSLKKKNFKTILIRGVGLKISFLDGNTNLLQLKLGYSHFIFLTVPKSVSVLILKKKIIVQSLSSTDVGNFSKKLMGFKKINSFTGKGLWLKNIQKFYCKPVKKR